MRLKPEVSPEQVRQIEEGEFTAADILAIIWTTISKLRDKPSVILWSSYLLLALWGFHGDMAILSRAFGEGWTSKITGGLAWGELLLSFIAGFLLMVVIPCLLIKFVFKESIRDYGLGLPEKDQRHKAWVAFFSLFAISSVFVVAGAFDASMQAEYPLFAKGGQGAGLDTITRWWEFAAYEAVYLLFFITIEFSFRGYLLFGLNSILITFVPPSGQPIKTPRFGLYAILIQMLAYTVWHHGKPVPELVGALVWGVCAAAIALRIRSIWPIIIAHWLYNVLLDTLLWGVFPLFGLA